MSGPSRLPRGARVGPFTLVRHLARGGTSDVYIATREGDPTPVALKLLAGLNAGDRARAEREATLAASLNHPAVARIFEHGACGPDSVFLAMELLSGRTLAQRLGDGPLAFADALALARRVLDALAHAHERGLIHRDVKPANLFLVDDDPARAKVLDFGLARALDGSRVTTPGRVLGTPAYMSPEQVRGDRDLDARTDLWAVGAVLFEALSGYTPFSLASPLATLFQVAFSAPRRLDELAPQLPASLVAVVDRALSRDPGGRFRDARAMRDALDAVGAVGARSTPRALAPHPEVRLLSVVLAARVRDARLVERLVSDLDARTLSTSDGLLAVFGLTRWRGDEPRRAVAFARAASLAAASVAVLTTHAITTGEAVPQEVLERAFLALPDDGVSLDDTTASLLRDVVSITLSPKGLRLLEDAPATASAPEHRAPFVGRSLERAMLVDAVERAAESSSASAVLVLGARGMGRTRLLDAALDALRERLPTAVVLRARCEPDRRESPYAALREALRDDLHPGLDQMLLTPSRSSDPQAAFDRARADLDALFSRLAARGPVVLVLDDAQWLDPASRELLRSLFDGATTPLTLWLAAESLSRAVLQSIAPGATVRELGPLHRADAEALVTALRGADLGSNARVVERAAGNPMLLEALATVPEDAELPVDVESAVRASLDRLDPDEREFVLHASVFGRVAWTEAAVELGVADRSGSLRAKGWITPRPRSRLTGATEFEFRSALVPEVARGVFPEASRAALHRRAAAWLARFDDAAPEDRATQWDLADAPDEAARAWVEAAARANRLGATEAASTYCERVLARTDDPTLRWKALTSRDDALQLNGDRSLQRKGIDALGALATALGGEAPAELRWRRLHHARMVGDEALAAESAPPEGEASRWSCAAHTELALFEADRARLVEARRHADRAVALAGALDDPWGRARAAHALAYVLVEQGEDLDAGLARYAQAAEGYRRAGDLRREAITQVNRGATFAALGRFADALDCLDLAIERARAVGNHRSVAVAMENRGAVRRMLGDLDAADEDLASALARAEALRHRRLSEAARVERLYLALARSDESLRARRDAVLPMLDEPDAAPHHDAALASCLRAARALGEPTAHLLGRALARCASALAPIAQLELRAALFAVRHDGEDVAAFHRALEAQLETARDDEDRGVRRRGIYRRFVVDEALRASSAPISG
ncbi:MAG: AAA family ATPase [Polyangiales bacterium]